MITLVLAQALAQSAPAPPEVPVLPATPVPAEVAAMPEAPAVPAVPSVPLAPRAFLDQALTVNVPTNDLFAMAQDIDITSSVGDNAFVMGESLVVSAPVSGDLFGMGSKVTIDAPVAGDVYAMGATVEITENGSVGGSLTVGAGELIVLGPVGGHLQAEVGRAVLGSSIAGDATLTAGSIDTLEGVAIAGTLVYESPDVSSDLERHTKGRVDYTRHVEDVVEVDLTPEPESSWMGSAMWWSGMRLWGYLTKLMVGTLIFLVGGAAAARVGRELSERPGASVGIGFVLSALLPAVSLLALVTILPFPLGLFGFTVFAVALYLGQIFAAQALGEVILRRLQPDAIGSPYISLAVGLLPLMALFAVPWIGNLAWLLATFAGIGALGLRIRGRA